MAKQGKHVQPAEGIKKAFGNAFREMREKRGISQEEVSATAECDRTTVSLVERGLVSPKLETIVRMCRAITTYPSEVMRTMERSPFYR